MRNSQDQRHDPPESLYTTFLAPIKDGPSNLWGAGVTTPYNWSYGTLLVTGDRAHLVFSSFIFSWCSLLDWQSTRNATTTSAKKNIEVGQSKYSKIYQFWGVMIPLLGSGSMGYGCILLRNGVYWGYNPLILTSNGTSKY